MSTSSKAPRSTANKVSDVELFLAGARTYNNQLDFIKADESFVNNIDSLTVVSSKSGNLYLRVKLTNDRTVNASLDWSLIGLCEAGDQLSKRGLEYAKTTKGGNTYFTFRGRIK